jgi:hypothetical protein
MEINAKFWASCEFAFVNEPKFLKLLFGIKSKEKPSNQMIFIHRAIFRGFDFWLKNPHFFLNCKKALYPFWRSKLSFPFMQDSRKRHP